MVLSAAMPTGAALKDLCAAETASSRQLLPKFIASRLPLTDAQWALIPIAPRLRLARALPAALARSGDQARQLVRRLPPADAERLRTAALCLAHAPQLPQQHLPIALVERILCAAVDGSQPVPLMLPIQRCAAPHCHRQPPTYLSPRHHLAPSLHMPRLCARL